LVPAFCSIHLPLNTRVVPPLVGVAVKGDTDAPEHIDDDDAFTDPDGGYCTWYGIVIGVLVCW
jgi:hypothetical protein